MTSDHTISNTPLTAPSNTVPKNGQTPDEGLSAGKAHDLDSGINPFETNIPESTSDYPAPPYDEQADIDGLVEILKEVAEEILEKLDTRQREEFQEQLAVWCEKHGFDSVEQSHTRTLIARQAALYLLLKATLYERYSHQRELPSLSAKRDIGFLLDGVWAHDVEIGWCILDDLISQLNYGTVEQILAVREELNESAQPAEDIGRVYAALVPKEDRLTLGQFRTPPGPGKLLRWWAVRGDDTVLDPGIGPGILSSSFHPNWKIGTDEKSVIGVDRSPLSTLMAKTTMIRYRLPYEVRETDFLQLSREELPNIDSIVCNPPYTQISDSTAAYQSTIDRFQEDSDTSIERKSPLYSHFITHATTLLDDGDRFALLIPAAWMHTQYGVELKQFLLDEYEITAVIGHGSNDFITGADVSSVIVLLERTENQAVRNHNEIVFGRLTESIAWIDEHGGVGQILSKIRDDDASGTPAFESVTRQQGKVDPEANWSQFMQSTAITTKISNHHHLAQLQDFAEVSYGRTTGHNKRFYLSDEEWQQENIEPAYQYPLLKGPKDHDEYVLTHEDIDKSLFHAAADESTLEPEAREYIEKVESELAEMEDTTKEKRVNSAPGPWYYIQPKLSEMTLPYGIHDRHSVYINNTNAHTHKRFVCIDPHEGVTQDILFALLNSTLETLLLELHGVVRNGGLLEMKSVGELPMIDLDKLTAADRAGLQAAAEMLKSEGIQPLRAQLGTADPNAVSIETVVDSQRAIDEIVMGDVMGLSQQEQEQVYQEVLQRVTVRIRS